MQIIAVALMYEMCRIQTLKASDLGKRKYIILWNLVVAQTPKCIQACCTNTSPLHIMLALADETFLNYLLDLVEHTRTDDAEQLNYGAIKLLLVFNEQYMLHTSSRPHHTQSETTFAYSGNPLLTVLTDRLGRSATFGENLIFMLNRAGIYVLHLALILACFVSACVPSNHSIINYDFFSPYDAIE